MVFQTQLSEGKFALLSCEELLEFATQTLTITDEEEFLKVEGDKDENPNPSYRLCCLKSSYSLTRMLTHNDCNVAICFRFQAAKQIKER